MLNMTVVGRLGRDVELRYVPGSQGETAVANIALACDYQGRDGKMTQWIDASMWGRRAEALAEHLTKGKQLILVLSDVHIETYQGQNGEGHKLVGRVENLEFGANPREDGDQGGGQRQQGGGQRQQTQGRGQGSGGRQAPQGRGNGGGQRQQPQRQSGGGSSGFDDMDDDIPF